MRVRHGARVRRETVISQTHPHDSPGTHEDHAVGQPGQGEAAWLTGWGPGCGCCRDRHCSDLGIAAPSPDPGGDPVGVRRQTLRSIAVAARSDAKVQNRSVGPPIWDSCDGRPDTQGWSYVINAYQFTSARSAAVVAGGCHQLITPAPRFNRLLAPCPRRAQTAGDSRPIAGSSGCPRPAQSSGPPRWIARIKLVPKLTVRVRFPSPAPYANSVAAPVNRFQSSRWRQG